MDMIQLLSMCDKSYIVQIMLIVKTFFKLACYIIPIIVIIATIINLFKPITSGKDEELKDNFKIGVRRIIAGLVVMLLPTLLSFVFNNFANGDKLDFLVCFNDSSKEMVERLKAKEEAEEQTSQRQQETEDERLLREAYEADQKKRDSAKQSFEEWKSEREANNNTGSNNNTGANGNNNVVVTTGGVDPSSFKNKLASMNTPTLDQIISAASQSGISADYAKIVLGTTFNEGYYNDPYLYYGWASAMINVPSSIEQMQGWDPGHSGEANFYSRTNINKGVNSATPDVLKAVYLAFTERNTKIVECNGMYNKTPAQYNLVYASSVYNCSVYEKK